MNNLQAVRPCCKKSAVALLYSKAIDNSANVKYCIMYNFVNGPGDQKLKGGNTNSISMVKYSLLHTYDVMSGWLCNN